MDKAKDGLCSALKLIFFDFFLRVMMQGISPDERLEITTLGVTLCMYLNTKKNRILCALL